MRCKTSRSSTPCADVYCFLFLPSRMHAQVLGIDAVRTKDVRVTHRAVLAHIAKVRTIKNLESATLVFCFESNLAFESQHLIHAIQEAGVKRWAALMEGAGGTLGWLTVRAAPSRSLPLPPPPTHSLPLTVLHSFG